MRYFNFLEEHPYFEDKFDNKWWIHYKFQKDNKNVTVFIYVETLEIKYSSDPLGHPEWFLEIIEQVERKKLELTRLHELTKSS